MAFWEATGILRENGYEALRGVPGGRDPQIQHGITRRGLR